MSNDEDTQELGEDQDEAPPPPPPPTPPTRCLGKHEPKVDERTLKLARYLPTSLAPAPEEVDWAAAAARAWGMMLNDNLGDCTCAAAGHAVQGWTANNGPEVTVPNAAVLAMYEGACGYVEGRSDTDRGGIEIDVLNYWRKVGIAGRKIKAFAALEPKNREHVKQSVFLFGGAYIGLALPLSAQMQTVWRYLPAGTEGDPTPGSWGGHAVWVVGYDREHVYFVSWGQVMAMTWAFWNRYCDESYAVLSEDWCTTAGAPSKFDLARLEEDLQLVAG